MIKKIYKEFILGDMRACYVQDEETGSMELVLLPADMDYQVAYREKPYSDSLVQVKLVGDTYAGGYAGGRTMRQSASVAALVFKGQEKKQENGETVIRTDLSDERGYQYRHFLVWKEGKKSLLSYTEFENRSNMKAEIAPHQKCLEHGGKSGIAVHGGFAVRTFLGRPCGALRALRAGGIHAGERVFPLCGDRRYEIGSFLGRDDLSQCQLADGSLQEG